MDGNRYVLERDCVVLVEQYEMAEHLTHFARKKKPNFCLKTQQEKQESKSTDDICYLENIWRMRRTKHRLSSELAEKQANEDRKLTSTEVRQHVLASWLEYDGLVYCLPQDVNFDLLLIASISERLMKQAINKGDTNDNFVGLSFLTKKNTKK